MQALLQRVKQARVEIDGHTVGAIDAGLLILVCAERGDTLPVADKLLAKILKLRIFADEQGKMNKSVVDVGGGLLIVSQFTLAADTSGGNRPSFGNAAPPAEGRRLYDYFVGQACAAHPVVQTGQFGADMQVHLVNDGPVTLPLRMAPEGLPLDHTGS
jgi:D-tyrosyl-tRNA(Tyr) deacylase